PVSASIPLENSRSKTSRGSTSGGIGVESVFQERLNWYAQLYPESHSPAVRPLSQLTSRDGNRVDFPAFSAAIWSTETPTLMSAPLVLRAWQPVRNVADARAWSPGPSPCGRALSCARPLMTWKSLLSGSSGWRMYGSS